MPPVPVSTTDSIRRTKIPWLVLLGTLALSVVAAWYVARTTNYAERQHFRYAVNNSARDIRDAIEDRIDAETGLLRGTAGLFAADEDLSSQQFHDYVRRLSLKQNYPGVQGLGFALQVPPGRQQWVEQEMRSQGLPNFHIWPRTNAQTCPVLYFESVDTHNRPNFGFDMYSAPVCRAAMDRARDTGRAAASGKITLKGETNQAGFLIYIPIYRGGVDPGDVAARRAGLLGFVYSLFQAHDLLQDIDGKRYSLIDFTVYDGTEQTPEHHLHHTGALAAGPAELGGQESFMPIDPLTANIAGQPWTLAFRARPEFAPKPARGLPALVLGGGSMIALVLFFAISAEARARHAAERTTAELSRSEAALRRSEARLRRLVESNMVGIVIRDPQGRVVDANDALLSMLGYTRQELLDGRLNSHDLTPEEFREQDERVIQAVRTTGTHAPYEKQCIRKDGSRIPVLVGAAILEGDPESLVEFVVDLSNLRKTEEALRRSEDQLRLVLDSIPVLITFTDRQSRVIFANRMLAEWFHVPVAEAIGKPLRDILGEERYRTSGFHIERALLGHRETYEHPLRRPDGTMQHLAVTLIPYVDAKGRVQGVVSLLTDITLRKEAENERSRLLVAEREARTEAEAANRTKDEFLATLSHELRTPLNAILGWAQLLRMGGLPGDEVQHGLETIERNARLQAQLVEDLLDLSRIISGKLRLDLRPVDLPTVLDAALDSVRPAAEAKGIQLIPVLDANASPVLGDPGRLQQVVWNLMSNAIKFTPSGGRVELLLQHVDHHAEIVVSDTGSGISPEFLPHVFDRLRQADSSSTRRHGGLGLGLSIVRHLVESHGGTVHAESKGVGRGATFVVSLPLAAHPPLTDGDGASSADRSEPHKRRLQGVRVLIVDDEPDARDLISRMLRQDGAEVRAAGSASEALGAIDEQHPDVLVSDIAMPGEDGYDLIRKLRSRTPSHGRDLPAIALTAFARTEDRDRALRAGYQTHLAKPIEPTQLTAAVAELIG